MGQWIKTNTNKLLNLQRFSVFWMEENKYGQEVAEFKVYGESLDNVFVLGIFTSQSEALDFLDSIYMELLKHETKSP